MQSEAESAGERRWLQVLAADGTVEREVEWDSEAFEIGRKGSDLECPEDSEMADGQVRLSWKGDRASLRDLGGGSGVWLRVMERDGRPLQPGDQVWVGAQILVFRRDGKGWEIRHHGPDGRLRGTHRVPAAGLFVGRASDLVLDPKDAHLSRRHAQLVPEGDALRLYDRSAHNGTYLKLASSTELSDGNEFRVARHRFRYRQRSSAAPFGDERSLDARTGNPVERQAASAISEPEVGSGPPRKQVPREGARNRGGLGARLRRLASKDVDETRILPIGDSGAADDASLDREEGDVEERALVVIDSPEGSVSLEAALGMTVLEAVQQAGLSRGEPVDWECSDGGCGVCVLGVVEGADRLDPPDPAAGEMKTIQITEQVVPDPTKYRLACLARVRGTVRLRKLT